MEKRHRRLIGLKTSNKWTYPNNYSKIIPQARMGYWLRGYEGERNNCVSKIQLVGQKYRD